MRTLSFASGLLMIIIALVIDFVLDPLVDILTFGIGGFIVDFLALIIFWPWMRQNDMHLFGPNAGGTLGTVIVEALPIFNMLPAWTARVAILVTREWRR